MSAVSIQEQSLVSVQATNTPQQDQGEVQTSPPAEHTSTDAGN